MIGLKTPGLTLRASCNVALPQRVKEGRIVPLLRIGPSKVSDGPDVPLLYDPAKTDAERQMIRLPSGNMRIERPSASPPGIPGERLEELRAASDATVKDAKVLAGAKTIGAESDPHSGGEAARIVELVVATPAAMV